MSTFPIKIEKISLDHQGGTKSYHTLTALTADGKGLLVKRWGKTGSFGQIEVVQTNRPHLDGQVIYNTKRKRGYEEAERKNLTAHDLDEFKRLLTPKLYTSLGAANLAYLIPDADTTGVKDAEKVEWEKGADGRMRPVEKAPIPMQLPEETQEDKIARNPLWGSF